MKQVSLNQDSPEWEEFRRLKVGGSDCPSICGVDPYKKAPKLFHQKYTGEKQYVSSAMNRGKTLEPIVRAKYEKSCGYKLPAVVGLHDTHDWMMASFDGYNEDRRIILEIKCPGEKVFNQIIIEGMIPKSYIYQIQHQLEVSGFDKAILVVSNGVYFEDFDITRDNTLISEIIEKERHFYECLIYGEYYDC